MHRLPGAGFYHGQHRHGPFNDAGGDRHIPAQWPEPVLGNDPARHSRHHACAGADGFGSYDARDCRDLLHTDRANRVGNYGAGYLHIGNASHNRNDGIGLSGTDSADDLVHAHNG